MGEYADLEIERIIDRWFTRPHEQPIKPKIRGGWYTYEHLDESKETAKAYFIVFNTSIGPWPSGVYVPKSRIKLYHKNYKQPKQIWMPNWLVQKKIDELKQMHPEYWTRLQKIVHD